MPLDTLNNLFYFSVHFDEGSFQFADAKVKRELCDLWLEDKIKTPGFVFQNRPPVLEERDVEHIPGAKVAMGHVDSLKLEVCVREGGSILIHPDETRYWQGAEDGYLKTFKELTSLQGSRQAP